MRGCRDEEMPRWGDDGMRKNPTVPALSSTLPHPTSQIPNLKLFRFPFPLPLSLVPAFLYTPFLAGGGLAGPRETADP